MQRYRECSRERPEGPPRPPGVLRCAALAAVFVLVPLLSTACQGADVSAQGASVPLLLGGQNSHEFARLLGVLAAIIVLGQALGWWLSRLGQPPVIGEVLAGILLGPSVLGPELSAWVLPDPVADHLGTVAQLGVMLYMFLVGLELNPALLRRHAATTMAAALGGIVVPFAVGILGALALHGRLTAPEVPRDSFVLFMGVAMSVTAFPVLARIVSDFGLHRTRLGAMALSCAAVSDMAAWCLLALAVGVARARMGHGLLAMAGLLALVACMLLLGRPAIVWITRRWEQQQPPRPHTTLVFLALMAAALACEAIGVHAFFGAFLLGAVIPHDSAAARSLTRQLEGLVTIVLLPAFFAFAGMRTRLDLFTEPAHWVYCVAIVLAATAGKLGGTFVAARFSGLPLREAAILGALMNTRGLMELVVLNVGLDLGVVSPLLFSMMVVMALATTALAPLLLRIFGVEAIRHAHTAPEEQAVGVPDLDA